MNLEQLDKLFLSRANYATRSYIGGTKTGALHALLTDEEVESILDGLTFDCKRCPLCCVGWVSRNNVKICSHLKEETKWLYSCDIHCSPNYSLMCELYPIMLDESTVKGSMQKIFSPIDLVFRDGHIAAESSWVYFIGLENYVSLEIHTGSPCWYGGGRPIRELFNASIRTIMRFDEKKLLDPEISNNLTTELVRTVQEELKSKYSRLLQKTLRAVSS